MEALTPEYETKMKSRWRSYPDHSDGKTVQENNLSGLEFKHPIDIGEAWKETSCHECHGLTAGTE